MIISIDGNGIGKILERYILQNKLEDLHNFSESIKQYIKKVECIILDNNGVIYMSGGDNIIADIPEKNINIILKLILNINLPDNITFAISLGKNTTLSYLALEKIKNNLSEYRDTIMICEIKNNELMFKPYII